MKNNNLIREQIDSHELDHKRSHEEERNIRKEKILLARLKRTLKPKIWEWVQFEIDSHLCYYITVVNIESVKGNKIRHSELVGVDSTPIRYAYEDISSCSYSETYGGVIWIPIGKGRYLEMNISG